MASKSRVSDTSSGAGGKLLRRRRTPPSASPYLRQSPRAGWLSGAGRFLSSVFSSERRSVDSDSDSSGSSDDDDCIKMKDDQMDQGQAEKVLQVFEAKCPGNQVVASTSKIKLAIEQLLEHETYTRDEASRLIEIIRSRIVEFPLENGKNGASPELLDRTCRVNNTVSASANFLDSPKHEYFLGRSSQLPSCLTTPYSISLIDHAHTRNAAMMEAKRWVEERKISSSSKFGEREDDAGSPVDLAKSYMRSLPPWESPIISRAGLRSPPSVSSVERYDSPYAINCLSSPFFEDLKRKYMPIRSLDSYVEPRDELHKTGNGFITPSIRSAKPSEFVGPSPQTQEEQQVSSAIPDLIILQTKALQDASKKQCVESSTKGDKNVVHTNNGNMEINISVNGEKGAMTRNTLGNDVETPENNYLTSEPQLQSDLHSLDHNIATHEDQVAVLEEASQHREQFYADNIVNRALNERNGGGPVEKAMEAEPIAVPSANTDSALFSLSEDGELGTERRRHDNFSGDNSTSDARHDVGNIQLQKMVSSSKAITNGVPSSPSRRSTRRKCPPSRTQT